MFSFKALFHKGKEYTLRHLEDDIINRVSQGGVNAVNFLNAVRNMLVQCRRQVKYVRQMGRAPAVFVVRIQKTANSLSAQNQYLIKVQKSITQHLILEETMVNLQTNYKFV